jgi:hypothetical protein
LNIFKLISISRTANAIVKGKIVQRLINKKIYKVANKVASKFRVN